MARAAPPNASGAPNLPGTRRFDALGRSGTSFGPPCGWPPQSWRQVNMTYDLDLRIAGVWRVVMGLWSCWRVRFRLDSVAAKASPVSAHRDEHSPGPEIQPSWRSARRKQDLAREIVSNPALGARSFRRSPSSWRHPKGGLDLDGGQASFGSSSDRHRDPRTRPSIPERSRLVHL